MATTRKVVIVAAAFTVTLFLFSVLGNKAYGAFGAITKPIKWRGSDKFGSGAFGATRAGGSRPHNGVDIVVQDKQEIYSPINGILTRRVYAYSDDVRYLGVEIENDEFTVKILYCKPAIEPGSSVKAGQLVAHAQDIGNRYPGITPHVHLEVYRNGQLIDPTKLYQK